MIGALFRSSPHDSAIFALALPAVLALAADPLLSMVDTIFVGQVGAADAPLPVVTLPLSCCLVLQLPPAMAPACIESMLMLPRLQQPAPLPHWLLFSAPLRSSLPPDLCTAVAAAAAQAGTDALAALGVNSALFTLAFVVFNFLATATTPMVAASLAVGDKERAGKVTLQASCGRLFRRRGIHPGYR